MAHKKYYREWSELPILLTLGQCAILFDKSYETIRLWVKKGQLPATQIGNEFLVAKTDIMAMFGCTQREVQN